MEKEEKKELVKSINKLIGLYKNLEKITSDIKSVLERIARLRISLNEEAEK